MANDIDPPSKSSEKKEIQPISEDLVNDLASPPINSADAVNNHVTPQDSQDKLKRKDIILGIPTLLTTIFLGFIAFYTWQFYERSFSISSRPRVILLEKKMSKRLYEIYISNMGAGVAYDIECNVHLSGGTLGYTPVSPFMVDVMKNAIYFQTKDKRQLKKNHAFRPLFSVANPPTVLPPNIDVGYSFQNDSPILMGLFIHLKYKDNQGQQYYSLWDGYKWTFGNESKSFYPSYESSYNPVTYFMDYLIGLHRIHKEKKLDEGDEDSLSIYVATDWLLREAKYLESKGDKQIRNDIKKIQAKFQQHNLEYCLLPEDIDKYFDDTKD